MLNAPTCPNVPLPYSFCLRVADVRHDSRPRGLLTVGACLRREFLILLRARLRTHSDLS
jgi:hypothetical protein